MCRLLGLISRNETTIQDALGTDFEAFTALSAGLHRDGWGVASSRAGNATITRAAEAAHSSEGYRAATSATISSAITHLRAATLGLPIAERNTHPFVHGELAFAHNGSIREIAAIEPLIDTDLRNSIEGDTDSERYLLALVSELRRAPAVEAVRAVAERLADVAVESSINALLLTPDELIIVADEHGKAPTFLDADHYALGYVERDGAIIVASSGWERDGWSPIPERTVVTIDRRTLQLRIHDLDVARFSVAA